MSDRDTKTPEFLQIKGYKYRAKMLIAAAIILIVLLILIISIVHGISSSLKSHKKTQDTDTDLSQSTVISTTSSRITDESTPSVSSSANDSQSKESFDADGKLIINGDTLNGKKAIAITFDDGPGKYTKYLVEELNSRGARATFFMLGSCVEQYPEVLPLMVSGGHQLGNHTYNHTDITTISNKEMIDQISKTDNAIFEACGQVSTAFRPPYGSCTDSTNKSINKTITLWSIDTLDWNTKSEGSVKDTIISQCKDGDIILLHDIYKHSVDGALAAIDELSKKGYIFVTVNELLTRYGYQIQKGKTHSSQYAVYETNSPYAEKYLKEINSQNNAKASSSAADSFYYESSQKSETSSVIKDSDSITIISSDTDITKKRRVY